MLADLFLKKAQIFLPLFFFLSTHHLLWCFYFFMGFIDFTLSLNESYTKQSVRHIRQDGRMKLDFVLRARFWCAKTFERSCVYFLISCRRNKLFFGVVIPHNTLISLRIVSGVGKNLMEGILSENKYLWVALGPRDQVITFRHVAGPEMDYCSSEFTAFVDGDKKIKQRREVQKMDSEIVNSSCFQIVVIVWLWSLIDLDGFLYRKQFDELLLFWWVARIINIHILSNFIWTQYILINHRTSPTSPEMRNEMSAIKVNIHLFWVDYLFSNSFDYAANQKQTKYIIKSMVTGALSCSKPRTS